VEGVQCKGNVQTSRQPSQTEGVGNNGRRPVLCKMTYKMSLPE